MQRKSFLPNLRCHAMRSWSLRTSVRESKNIQYTTTLFSDRVCSLTQLHYCIFTVHQCLLFEESIMRIHKRTPTAILVAAALLIVQPYSVVAQDFTDSCLILSKRRVQLMYAVEHIRTGSEQQAQRTYDDNITIVTANCRTHAQSDPVYQRQLLDSHANAINVLAGNIADMGHRLRPASRFGFNCRPIDVTCPSNDQSFCRLPPCR